MTLEDYLTSEGHITDSGWLIVKWFGPQLFVVGKATSEKDAIKFAKKLTLQSDEQSYCIFKMTHIVAPSTTELEGETIRSAKTTAFED